VTERFSADELAGFARDGYVVVRGLADAVTVARLRAVAARELAARSAPLELEAETGYPGAPAGRAAPGGETVRRLLQACGRDAEFRDWATAPAIAARLKHLLGPQVVLSQAHHNCVMTKRPGYSSVTGWHRDVRYWSFERPELVSVWTALGPERRENGCLLVLPGTHRMEFASERLDERQFLRADLAENAPLLATETAVELKPGDVLFFHARLFHAAGRNRTADTKYSLVFTYGAADNRPLPGTRSASLPGVLI
jgi:phytanoyl-CoA hydroxylase